MAFQWYVIRAVAGQEKKAKQYLESEIERLKMQLFISQILIPTEKVYEMKKGKDGKQTKVIKERSYLPGYVLIEADLTAEVIQSIKDTPGIIGFLATDKGATPTPMKESEVKRILGKVDELGTSEEVMENPFLAGETVKVIDGQFIGFSGVVEEVQEEKKKLRVIIKMFERNTPVELNFMQVERVL